MPHEGPVDGCCETPTVGVDVECHDDKVCVVQLASWSRGLVLDALALEGMLQDLLQPLLGDERVCKVFHGHFNGLTWLCSNFSIVVNPPICDTAANGMWEGGPPSLQTLCRQYLHYELDKTYQDGQLAPEADVCGDAAVRGNRRPGTPSAAGCDDRSDACPRLGLRLGDVDSLRLRGGDVRNLFFVLCSLSGHIF